MSPPAEKFPLAAATSPSEPHRKAPTTMHINPKSDLPAGLTEGVVDRVCHTAAGAMRLLPHVPRNFLLDVIGSIEFDDYETPEAIAWKQKWDSCVLQRLAVIETVTQEISRLN